MVIRQGAVWAEAGLPPGVDYSAAPAIVDRRTLPEKAEVQQLLVRHRTTYRYENRVEHSTHVLRLAPAHDRLQSLLDHQVTLSVDGQQREYEDVFGNFVRSVSIETPYNELVIEARSLVELWDINPLNFRALRARTTIPLVWMPWQRHMLQPFLLPQELPDSELHELVEYAMSFVHRNDYDILDTLLDLNTTIFKEYAYKQGETTVQTTPFEVYANRRGVCQDFTNLFICLCRLMGVPARYVCGYLYTGAKNPNQRQGEASHAWAQVYLPEVGWKGFDPTNGVLTQTNHIRVAIGRNYVDATPTAGTIYVGGGAETLEVEVRVAPFMEWKEE
jgi:transglutaminase-like putative cysteine protease